MGTTEPLTTKEQKNAERKLRLKTVLKSKNDSTRLSYDYFNMAANGSIILAVVNFLFLVLLRPSLYSLIVSGLYLLYSIIVKVLAVVTTDNKRRIQLIEAFCIMITCIFFPVMFLTSGSIDSGIPSFYIFGIVVTFLLLSGKTLLIVFIIEFLVTSLMYAFTMKEQGFADSFTVLGDTTYLYIAFASLIVGWILGMILRRLMHKLEEERETSTELVNKLQDYSNKDALSSAYNRRFLHAYLEECIRRVDTKEINTFSIIMFDIDHFKNVNDEYGHLAGDEVIRNLSATINGCMRSVDVVSRYGGEEFVCVMPTADETPAFRRAEQIRQKVESSQLCSEINRPVTISGGVAGYISGMGPSDIIKEADKNLYIAKESGRNQIVWHSGGIPPLCYNAYDENTGVLDASSKKRSTDKKH
jgi:diguanylate cyclase (GGDEF)-like protein